MCVNDNHFVDFAVNKALRHKFRQFARMVICRPIRETFIHIAQFITAMCQVCFRTATYGNDLIRFRSFVMHNTGKFFHQVRGVTTGQAFIRTDYEVSGTLDLTFFQKRTFQAFFGIGYNMLQQFPNFIRVRTGP